MWDWIEYHPNWLGSQFPDLMQQLMSQVDWQQPLVNVFNQWHKIPRQQAWYGDSGLRYVYSAVEHIAEGWPDVLNELRLRLHQQANQTFNSVLLNRYRNGNDKMGWHADNEVELGVNPCVAIVSLGANREMQFKHLKTKTTTQLNLTDGSLLIMKPGMQSRFHHQIPVRKRVESERISLTFRQILTNT